MEIQTRNDQRFGVVVGKRAADIVLPAMPIRIVYLSSELDYVPEMKNGEHFFRVRMPERHTPGWIFGPSWDAYGLRTSFESLRRPEDAQNFLNVIGLFRYKRRQSKHANGISWRELEGWQMVVRQLRLRDSSEGFPLLGVREFDSKETFYQLLADAKLEDFCEQIWNVSDETCYWLQGIPQGLSIRRDVYLSREETEAIFASPGARVPGSRAWHEAQAVLESRREERARGNPEAKQKLIAEVTAATALDAILATVYVDKLRGLDLQVCALKECNKTFERSTDHRKIYCSQTHAHLASVRRKRANEKRARAERTRRKEKAK